MDIRKLTQLLVLVSSAATVVPSVAASEPQNDEATRARVEKAAVKIAIELTKLCPVSDPADQAAFDACRAGLYRDSQLKRSLRDFVLWGRQVDPQLSLKNSNLTQFGPDVLAGMYVPLFMFNGEHRVSYVESEKLYTIRFRTAFRNGLTPGQFPYPFWHDPNKWAGYENASEAIFWWDPKIDKVRAVQFTKFGLNPPLISSAHITPPAFDGQWRWTDAQGKSQPAVTVFDGLLQAKNPYIAELDTAYKSLALRLRKGQCFECHVPNNPDHSKRLVLLQTPMHAAAEIKRLMKSVRDDRMPRDEYGVESPLDAPTKQALLEEGAAFESVLDKAKAWEATHTATR